MAGTDKLGDFLVKLGFSVDGVDKLKGAVHELEQMREVFESIRAPFHAFNETLEALKTIGEAVIAPFEALYEISSESAHAADELEDLSKQLGISSHELQEWGYVAEVSGSSAGEMQGALRRDIAQAANGSKEAAKQYKQLGVEFKNADGSIRSAGDVLGDVLGKLSEIPDEAKRAAKGMEFFGRGGANIRSLFGVGLEELEALRAEFELLGGRTPEALMKLGEEQKRYTQNLATFTQGLRNWFAVGFQPVINGVLKWFNDLAVKYGPGLREFLLSVGDTLAQIGFVVGGAIDTFVGAFKAIADNIDIILPLVALWKYEMIAAAVSTIAAWALAALPFIALFLVIEDLFGFLQGKDSLIGELVKHWDEWTESLSESHPILATILATIGDLAGMIKMAAKFVMDLVDAFRILGAAGSISWIKNLAVGSFDALKNTVGSLFGGGTTIQPSASAVSSSSTSISNNSAQASINQTVNAAPGMNERDVANQSAGMMKDFLHSELRAAYPAAVPSR